jgi:hypothetical protein
MDISARSLKIGLLALIVVLSALVLTGLLSAATRKAHRHVVRESSSADVRRVKARTAENSPMSNQRTFRTIHQGAIE